MIVCQEKKKPWYIFILHHSVQNFNLGFVFSVSLVHFFSYPRSGRCFIVAVPGLPSLGLGDQENIIKKLGNIMISYVINHGDNNYHRY